MTTAKKKSVEVEMSDLKVMKANVKFETDQKVSPNNIYMRKETWESLGSPERIKVTVQPA